MNALREAAQRALEAWNTGDLRVLGPAMGALRAALAQEQAEPLNLLDRAVQRRLAAQWGYVPAQAEPVQEPVARVMISSNVPGRIDEMDVLKALPRGEHLFYTAPPRRTMVLLTEREIGKLTAMFDARHSVRVGIARAVEKASWEKNHG